MLRDTLTTDTAGDEPDGDQSSSHPPDDAGRVTVENPTRRKERWISKRAERRRSTQPSSHSRGQAEMLGLMLGLVIIASLFVMLQTDVAPAVREEYEYQHARTVLEDFLQIHTDTRVSADAGIGQGTVLHMGGDYPSYVVLLQPPGPSGSVRTTAERTVSLTNAQATDRETREYLSGQRLTFSTTGVRYTPNYEEYRPPPTTVLMNCLLYQEYAQTREVVAGPRLIAGRTISITTMAGQFSTARTTPLLIQTEPLSTSRETVRVESDGQPITLSIQTQLSESQWREVLAAEIDPETSRSNPATDDDNRYVAAIDVDESTTPNTLTIYLETGVAYDLRMSRIGIRTGQQAPFAESEAPPTAYITAASDQTPILAEETSQDLVVEVRDTYNNPQSGVKVRAEILSGGGSLDRIEDLTRQNGRATFTYTAPEISQSTAAVSEREARVRVTVVGENGPLYRVTYTVRIQNIHD